jgi:hypothetical protein
VVSSADTETLKEAGIYGNHYKVILGSKSSSPMVRPEDAAPVKLVHSYYGVQSNLTRDFKECFTHDEIRKLSSVVWLVSTGAVLFHLHSTPPIQQLRREGREGRRVDRGVGREGEIDSPLLSLILPFRN